jgi:hypothetical protein
MLSSQPLCFNLFGPMKLDDALSNRFWSKLFPAKMAQFEQILFGHSPGRGGVVYTDDNTAFDGVLVESTSWLGSSGSTSEPRLSDVLRPKKYFRRAASAQHPAD